MADISRMPDRAMFSVRGMGVAERVRVSTCSARFRSCSLAATPKRCSSSMMSRPRSWKTTFFCSSLWVPMSRSTFPWAVRSRMSLACPALRNRLNTSTVTGKLRNRLTAVA